FCFFFQAEDGIRDFHVTGVQTCALPISALPGAAFSFQAGAVAPALGGRRCPEPREQSFDVHSDREPRPCGFRWTAKAMEERSQPMSRFRALRVYQEAEGVAARVDELGLDDLSPGNVVIQASYSCINYKDAMAVTGTGRVVRRYPLVPGIDVAGRIVHSDDERYKEGERVLVTGYGLGEHHDGGYSELVRVNADWLIRIPDGLSEREAMQIGTAGFTAALALERLERAGTNPAAGPVLVTGATGGVGSLAIDIFSKAGYSVTALTGKPDQADYLRALGADEVLHT